MGTVCSLDRDGIRIHYERHPARTAARATILLSHGYSATSRMWTPQLGALTEHYNVLIWDMRGHGKTDSPEDPDLYSEALTVEDMRCILDAENTERAVIAGLSLGGYMSLAFAMAHPDRVQALMVFDTGPGYRKDEARDGWNRNAIATARSIEKKGFAGLNTSSAEVASAQHQHPHGLALAARGMLSQRDGHVMAGLAGITVPTLVLAGENDTPFLAATEYMAAKIPGAVRVIIEGAGHAANLDRPKAFNKAVLEFLATL